jgi:cell shape-determining protein MreD
MSMSGESEGDVETKRLAAEKKVVRKVDWMLMPILMITLGLQYYDKAVLGSAAVFGILEDMVSPSSRG